MALVAERLLDDASPLVRGAAVWALSQLMGRGEFEARAARAISTEADAAVRAEWQLAESVMGTAPAPSAVMLRESGASGNPRR
jgi:epoxyqueuosine reductase